MDGVLDVRDRAPDEPRGALGSMPATGEPRVDRSLDYLLRRRRRQTEEMRVTCGPVDVDARHALRDVPTDDESRDRPQRLHVAPDPVGPLAILDGPERAARGLPSTRERILLDLDRGMPGQLDGVVDRIEQRPIEIDLAPLRDQRESPTEIVEEEIGAPAGPGTHQGSDGIVHVPRGTFVERAFHEAGGLVAHSVRAADGTQCVGMLVHGWTSGFVGRRGAPDTAGP